MLYTFLGMGIWCGLAVFFAAYYYFWLRERKTNVHAIQTELDKEARNKFRRELRLKELKKEVGQERRNLTRGEGRVSALEEEIRRLREDDD